MNILVFGLPGSGKTTFSKLLNKNLNFAYFNADEVRGMFNDWDFSNQGRINQANRMIELINLANKPCIVDFVCPYEKYRNFYDITVWMNTINKGRYEDTNKIFEIPKKPSFEILDYNYEMIIKEIREIINEKK
jgi:adenylylsulfate kinase